MEIVLEVLPAYGLINVISKSNNGQYAWVCLSLLQGSSAVLNKAVLLLWEKRVVSGRGEGRETALPEICDRVVLKVFQAEYQRLKSYCFWCPGAAVKAPWRSLKMSED